LFSIIKRFSRGIAHNLKQDKKDLVKTCFLTKEFVTFALRF
jgi:hypothetical protein